MAPRPVFPVSLLLESRPCLVVGGRATALLRVQGLLDAGADVTVVAPDVLAELAELPVRIHRREFREGDTAGFVLVVSATGDAGVDARVHADGRREGVLVNAVDNPASCDLYIPAVLRRGQITVSISTGGASPAMASWARNRIAEALPEEIGDVGDIVARIRTEVRAEGRSSEGLPWQALIDELADVIAGGGSEQEVAAIVSRWRAALADLPPAGSHADRGGIGPTDG